MKQRIIWHLRQLLPLTYRSRFHDGSGQRYFCVWNMWFGRCYNIESYPIPPVEGD